MLLLFKYITLFTLTGFVMLLLFKYITLFTLTGFVMLLILMIGFVMFFIILLLVLSAINFIIFFSESSVFLKESTRELIVLLVTALIRFDISCKE